MPEFETPQQDATYAVPHDPEAQARQDAIDQVHIEASQGWRESMRDGAIDGAIGGAALTLVGGESPGL